MLTFADISVIISVIFPEQWIMWSLRIFTYFMNSWDQSRDQNFCFAQLGIVSWPKVSFSQVALTGALISVTLIRVFSSTKHSSHRATGPSTTRFLYDVDDLDWDPNRCHFDRAQKHNQQIRDKYLSTSVWAHINILDSRQAGSWNYHTHIQ